MSERQPPSARPGSRRAKSSTHAAIPLVHWPAAVVIACGRLDLPFADACRENSDEARIAGATVVPSCLWLRRVSADWLRAPDDGLSSHQMLSPRLSVALLLVHSMG